MMSKYINTRNPCQIRSHWQKVMEKIERDSQKIGRNSLNEDTALGKYNLSYCFRDFSIPTLDSLIGTRGALLNPKAIQLNSMVNNLGKRSCRQTRSMLPNKQERQRGS